MFFMYTSHTVHIMSSISRMQCMHWEFVFKMRTMICYSTNTTWTQVARCGVISETIMGILRKLPKEYKANEKLISADRSRRVFGTRKAPFEDWRTNYGAPDRQWCCAEKRQPLFASVCYLKVSVLMSLSNSFSRAPL